MHQSYKKLQLQKDAPQLPEHCQDVQPSLLQLSTNSSSSHVLHPAQMREENTAEEDSFYWIISTMKTWHNRDRRVSTFLRMKSVIFLTRRGPERSDQSDERHKGTALLLARETTQKSSSAPIQWCQHPVGSFALWWKCGGIIPPNNRKTIKLDVFILLPSGKCVKLIRNQIRPNCLWPKFLSPSVAMFYVDSLFVLRIELLETVRH